MIIFIRKKIPIRCFYCLPKKTKVLSIKERRKRKRNNFSSRYFTMYNFVSINSPTSFPSSSPLSTDFFTRASWRTPFGLPERVRATFSGFLARPLSLSLPPFSFLFLRPATWRSQRRWINTSCNGLKPKGYPTFFFTQPSLIVLIGYIYIYTCSQWDVTRNSVIFARGKKKKREIYPRKPLFGDGIREGVDRRVVPYRSIFLSSFLFFFSSSPCSHPENTRSNWKAIYRCTRDENRCFMKWLEIVEP